MSVKDVEKADIEHSESPASSETDLSLLHDQAGRLVIDPECVMKRKGHSVFEIIILFREAKIEFGEAIASKLKLSRDGTKVLWPQPTDSPDDPQNWSDRRKALQLIIITLAAIVPDFDSGIGESTSSWSVDWN